MITTASLIKIARAFFDFFIKSDCFKKVRVNLTTVRFLYRSINNGCGDKVLNGRIEPEFDLFSDKSKTLVVCNMRIKFCCGDDAFYAYPENFKSFLLFYNETYKSDLCYVMKNVKDIEKLLDKDIKVSVEIKTRNSKWKGLTDAWGSIKINRKDYIANDRHCSGLVILSTNDGIKIPVNNGQDDN